MQIILTEAEVRTAVEAYARNKITLHADQKITIDFATTRNPVSVTANLEIITIVASEHVDTQATPSVDNSAVTFPTTSSKVTANKITDFDAEAEEADEKVTDKVKVPAAKMATTQSIFTKVTEPAE